MQDRYNFNYYKDSCVTKAGGKTLGTIDFYQIHTYSSCQCDTGSWRDEQPMKKTKDAYRLDKPLIIGEFSAACSARNSVSSMYQHFYEVRFSYLNRLINTDFRKTMTALSDGSCTMRARATAQMVKPKLCKVATQSKDAQIMDKFLSIFRKRFNKTLIRSNATVS